MIRARALAPALAAVSAAALGAGCGLGPGDSTDGRATTTLTVTRDYGVEPVLQTDVSDPPESETVMRLLDREAEIETRYGGGFVQSIEGVEGGFEDGRSHDWFFYVNGVESQIGAADVSVQGGDRIWWDHHDWTSAMRVPAVVGSWPEPFLQASADSGPDPVRVECRGERPACDAVQSALADAGVSAATEPEKGPAPADALRILVGPWQELRADPVARLVERGPAHSGIFATFEDGELAIMDEAAVEMDEGEGLVAATREGDSQPTWLVTGVDAEGVLAAVKLLDDDILRDRYAVASVAGEAVALPVADGGAAP